MGILGLDTQHPAVPVSWGPRSLRMGPCAGMRRCRHSSSVPQFPISAKGAPQGPFGGEMGAKILACCKG